MKIKYKTLCKKNIDTTKPIKMASFPNLISNRLIYCIEIFIHIYTYIYNIYNNVMGSETLKQIYTQLFNIKK